MDEYDTYNQNHNHTSNDTYHWRRAYLERIDLRYFIIWRMPVKECRLPLLKLNFGGRLQY
jgi:hypothetical protein